METEHLPFGLALDLDHSAQGEGNKDAADSSHKTQVTNLIPKFISKSNSSKLGVLIISCVSQVLAIPARGKMTLLTRLVLSVRSI